MRLLAAVALLACAGLASPCAAEAPPRLRGVEWGWLAAPADRSALTARVATQPITHLDVNPDGALLALASGDGRLRLVDPKDLRVARVIEAHGSAAWTAAFSPDGRSLLSFGSGGAVRTWDVATGDLVLAVPFEDGAWDVAWSPDGRRLAIAVLDGTLAILDADPGER